MEFHYSRPALSIYPKTRSAAVNKKKDHELRYSSISSPRYPTSPISPNEAGHCERTTMTDFHLFNDTQKTPAHTERSRNLIFLSSSDEDIDNDSASEPYKSPIASSALLISLNPGLCPYPYHPPLPSSPPPSSCPHTPGTSALAPSETHSPR